MTYALSINELKKLGTRTIDKKLSIEHEIIITSHGKNKYALVEYNEILRIHNERLEYAYLKVQQELAEGKGYSESADEHIARLKKALST